MNCTGGSCAIFPVSAFAIFALEVLPTSLRALAPPPSPLAPWPFQIGDRNLARFFHLEKCCGRERTVKRLIEEAHRENLRLLGEHREELDEVASRLLDRVEIAGDEVREVVGRRRKGEAAAAADQAAA